MKPHNDDDRLQTCEQCLDYHFEDRDLLALALTHASDKAGRTDLSGNASAPPSVSAALADNERLEFLGDAILGMVICETLFERYPNWSEGDLTNVKSVVVSRDILAKMSDELGLAGFMSLGKGMTTQSRLPKSLRANVFEAVVAAIHLDGGLEAARAFIIRNVAEHIKRIEKNEYRKNYKSTLQQYAQREFSITPTYRVINEQGPDHIKEFEVVAIIGDKEYAAGRGKSKKDAEREAAEHTLRKLKEEEEEA